MATHKARDRQKACYDRVAQLIEKFKSECGITITAKCNVQKVCTEDMLRRRLWQQNVVAFLNLLVFIFFIIVRLSLFMK